MSGYPPSRGRCRARLPAAAGVLLGTLLVAPSAGAILINTTVTRDDQRPTAEDPFTISFDDCVSDNQFTFTISSVQVGSTLSVWATVSADCTDLQTRNEGLCFQIVEPFQLSNDSLTQTVSATAMANTLANVLSCVDSGATDAPRPIKLYFLIDETTDPVTEFATYDTYVDLLGPPPPTSVSVGVGDQDMLTVNYTAPTSSTDVQGYVFYCEAAGPPVVTAGGSGGAGGAGGSVGGAGGAGLGRGAGADGRAGGNGGTAGAGASSGGAGGLDVGGAGGFGGAAVGGAGPSGGGDLGGGGSSLGGAGGAGATGAGAAAAGGSAAGGGSASGDCTAPHLLPGQLAPAGFETCGETTSATSGQATGLSLGVEYAVAVAGYDIVGNKGKLSELACGAPEPVDDFFEIYRKAGGQAGGGYCGHCAAPGADRSGGLGAAVSLGAIGVWLGRRRRSVGRRPS